MVFQFFGFQFFRLKAVYIYIILYIKYIILYIDILYIGRPPDEANGIVIHGWVSECGF